MVGGCRWPQSRHPRDQSNKVHKTMGTAYSSYTDACRLSSRSAHSSNSGAANESLPNHGFSELETDHLIGLCRLVCHERLRQVQQEKDSETCFLSLIWRCSHLLALQPKSHAGLDLSEENLNNMEARLTQIPSSQIDLIQKRRQQLETICTPSLLNTAMNDSLENIFCNAGSNATQETATTANQSTSSEVVDKKEADEQFLEFASNMLWRHGRGHNQKNTLDFAWNVCQHICINSSGNRQSNSTDGTVLAKDIIELCFQSAIMIHYMLQDDAFDNAASGDGKANRAMALLEPRNTTAENNTIQALANSLLEYAQHYRADHKFGGYGGGGGFDTSTSSAEATNPAEGTVTKREFSEWQRKVVPDLMCYSIVKFFQILFFPPGLSQLQQNQQPTDGSPQFLFQQYTPTFPIIHSSKELSSRNANTEIIPVLSPVFGSNVRKQTSDNSDDENISATTLLSPPVFAFVSISASKFGEKWYRIFDGSDNGWAFQQLEHAIIGYQGPTLLLIKACTKHSSGSHTAVTFGAYTASKWEKNKKQFFGASDCFLFQLEPTLRVLKSLPKMGKRGGNYMYFHTNTNANMGNPSKKDDMAHGLGFGGTVRNPRLFVDVNLEECRVSSQDTSFEEGHLGFPPSNDPFSTSFSGSASSSSTLHIDSLEVYAVGDEDTLKRGFEAQFHHRDIADATLRNARTVDKAAFLGDLRNGVVETKAFAHRGQVDGRAHGCLKGEEGGKANGL